MPYKCHGATQISPPIPTTITQGLTASLHEGIVPPTTTTTRILRRHPGAPGSTPPILRRAGSGLRPLVRPHIRTRSQSTHQGSTGGSSLERSSAIPQESSSGSYHEEGHPHHTSRGENRHRVLAKAGGKYHKASLDFCSTACGSQSREAGIIRWREEVHHCRFAFWPLEVRPDGVKASDKSTSGRQRHSGTSHHEKLRILRGSSKVPGQSKSLPNGALYPPRGHNLSGPDTLPGGHCSTDPACGWTVQVGSPSLPTAHRKWTNGLAATESRLHAVELAIKHELQAGSPGPPGDPNWRLLYYQGEVKVEFEGGPSPHPKPRCTLPLDPIAVSTVDVEALHQWANNKLQQPKWQYG